MTAGIPSHQSCTAADQQLLALQLDALQIWMHLILVCSGSPELVWARQQISEDGHQDKNRYQTISLS